MQPGSVNFVNTPESDAARLQPRYTFGFDPALAQSSPQSVSYDTLRSVNYVSGSAGWRIDGNGNAEFNNVTVRGTIITGGATSPHIVISTANGDRIQFFTGNANESSPGDMRVFSSGILGTLQMDCPQMGLGVTPVPAVQLQHDTTSISAVTLIGKQIQLGTALGSLSTLQFFAGGGNPQQTVTGSRGGNAALASLLTGLANYGLIIDSSGP